MKTFRSLNTGKIALALLLVLAITGRSYSQKPDRKTTLSYINKKLAPLCVIEMRTGTLIATFTEADGKKVREDKVPAFELDTAVIYDSKDKILSVNCISDRKDCVTRTLYKLKIKRQYNRISFVVNDETQVENLRKALIHLIRIDSEFKYSDEITFE